MQISASSVDPPPASWRVAGVFADVGDIPINWRRHLLANQIRLFGMTNHPPTGSRPRDCIGAAN